MRRPLRLVDQSRLTSFSKCAPLPRYGIAREGIGRLSQEGDDYATDR